MKYALEGSNSGYPLCEDDEDRYFDYLQSHHDCCICGDKNVNEELMYRTTFGWMHTDCYDEIIACGEGEIPEIL